MGSGGDSAGLLLGPPLPCCSGLPAARCSGTKASQDATDPSGLEEERGPAGSTEEGPEELGSPV